MLLQFPRWLALVAPHMPLIVAALCAFIWIGGFVLAGRYAR